MKITKEKVNDIAQELSCGMTVYLNTQTGEIHSIVDLDAPFVEPELWDDVVEKIEQQRDQSVEIQPMGSDISFRVMKDFISEIPDRVFQNILYIILSKKQPFATFKSAIDNSPYRQQWFEFKDQALIDYVADELDMLGIEVIE